MQNWPWLIYLFFEKRRIIFTVMILAVCGVLGYYASKIRLEEDISRFVPQDRNSASINSILENLKSKDKLVVHFTASDPSKVDEMVEAADHVYDTILKAAPKASYSAITYKVSDNMMQHVYEIFYRNLPLFLSDADYSQIGKQISADSIAMTVRRDYQTLLSPSGIVLSKFITRDPLNIVPLALKKIGNIQIDDNFEIYNGAIVTKDHKHLLMFLTPAYSSSETAKNKPLIAFIKGVSGKYKTKELNIEPFGAFMVALDNAEQIRKDSMTTSTIAIIFIALLIGLYFKNPLPVIFILLPVGFGMVFSLSLLFIFKGVVSAIAVGSGAVVLGIAINYSLHFFTHYKHTRSAKEVLSDLTVPMLIGCTTTVGAFFSLSFVKSEALHDFGQFAAYSLIGAILFSVIVLPHLLTISFRKNKTEQAAHDDEPAFLRKLVNYRFDKNKIIVYASLLVTIVLCCFASNAGFESDMSKMNFMQEETRLAEKHLDEVNNFAARSVYVFVSGDNLEQALQRNEQVSEKLDSMKQRGGIRKFNSIASVYPSAKMQEERLQRWEKFFGDGVSDSVQARLTRSGEANKFKTEAFQSFYGLMNKPFSPLGKSDADSLAAYFTKEWITTVKGRSTIINHIKVDAENKEAIYTLFANSPGVLVFDKQHLTSQFVSVINSDFSTILWVTSILVFGFMLISHGRIELAVINFLPMLISWLWILGIMGIFGIKFNIINIIISTFIFGLGDDYSIFIMDGLLTEYRTGKQTLTSYKTSILLSAMTSVIGIGVMIFAKHPALRSIALITIIGMCCVVFVSFIVQPLIFNFIALRRKQKGLLPYTFRNVGITVLGFLIFMIFALMLTIIGALIFTVFPAGKKKRKLMFHYVIMGCFRFILAAFVNVKKKIINESGETFESPALIVSNHQSHIDLALTLQLHPKIIVFTNDWVYNSPFYGFIVKMADYYPASEGYEKSLPKLKNLVADGYSILIFPEGTRSVDGDIHRFHKGAFLLAETLGLDTIPVLIHGAGDAVTKGDFHFKDGALTVKILPRIKPDDQRFGSSYQERTKGICAYMRKEYDKLREQCEPVAYYRSRMIANYIYKGPTLEWYCRIKTKLENNYELFESLLPKKGQIVDVGCGYGFLPYMLYYKSRARKILGLDFDEEKITVAKNCPDANPQLSFDVADATTYDYPSADGFIISDVLHYLEPSQQVDVIRKLAKQLNAGGVLVIRDADADMKSRQRGTWYTEFYSTNSGFNKTSESGLHFVSGTLIKDTLAEFPELKVEIIDNTRFTSNIIYVARKS